MSREYPKNSEPKKIEAPNVGRIVLYRSWNFFGEYPAIVVQVGEGLTIEILHAFLPEGLQVLRDIPHVSLLPDGEVKSNWDWMDYQKGQAKIDRTSRD